MKEVLTEQEKQRRREYHRRWRAEHPENIRAAQMRYWTRQALIEKDNEFRLRQIPGANNFLPNGVEVR